MHTQFFNKSLTELIRLIDTKQATVIEIVEDFYRRIDARDDRVQAWQYLIDLNSYIEEYENQKEFYDKSILKGLPFAVKDVIDTKDITTTMGSSLYAERVPQNDAACVTALKNAGGILMGKTVTTEFAYFSPGKTNNPHHPDRTPGGSSSGSAAAVADYMVPIALGTQTAASVIRPASYCGTFAYVGSRDEFSLRNIQPLSSACDSLGIFANHLNDIKLVRRVLQHAKSPHPQTKYSIEDLRFAVFAAKELFDAEAVVYEKLTTTQQHLVDNGFDFVDVSLDQLLGELTECQKKIMAYEVARNLFYEYSTGEISQQLADLIESGFAMSYQQWLDNKSKVAALGEQLEELLDANQIDFILAPASPGIAPLKTEGTGNPFFSRAWQILGYTSINLPLFYLEKHPLGLQIVGRRHSDDKLLAIAEKVMRIS
ncbi:MAG: amidase [Alcaligenaceae bacterium]|nr:amidase [Alcaligenaceae bacterium]